MNLAEALNLGCACQTLETQRLREQLETEPALAGLTERLASSHPHLFSRTATFIDAGMAQKIDEAVAALERVIALPAWNEQALARAPGIARLDPGPVGVFMGYDFHLAHEGPRLIEINSNAGGALLNAALARAHSACCETFQHVLDPHDSLRRLDDVFMNMFLAEWRLQRGDAPLRNVLIVDDAPDAQYLAPEFQMARALLAARGLQAAVADARALRFEGGGLRHPALPDGVAVDMVYNRLTDFYFQEPAHAALRQAWESGAAVITPHPRTHALYADKRNLIALSDDALLQRWGVSDADRALLRRVVPATQRVMPERADALWAQRRTLFFKPAAGFGARAAYRGDKLTRRVWEDILAGDYVAQAIVPPSERLVAVGSGTVRLKLDLRAYTYQGQVQLLAARTWSGQTTNFRTEGGGFSPVVVLAQPAPASNPHRMPDPDPNPNPNPNCCGRKVLPMSLYNVLFLCTGNSARSIMAESILNHLGRGRFRAFSAGSHPAGQVNAHAIELLQRNRYQTDGLRSKNWSEFALADAPHMHFVLTVCDKAAGEMCPV